MLSIGHRCPLSAKSGHRRSLLIAPGRQVTNGSTQCGKDLDAVSGKTPRSGPVSPLSCPPGSIQSYAASFKHLHQFGDGEQSGRIDVGNRKQVDNDVT